MNMLEDVEDFQIKAGHQLPQYMIPLKSSEILLEATMLWEELNELVTAMCKGDHAAIADGGVDLIYVVIGTLLKHGITPERFERVWAEVQRSNLDKVKDGVEVDGLGKIMKPGDWTPPDVKGALGL